jgi:hypothetical protein
MIPKWVPDWSCSILPAMSRRGQRIHPSGSLYIPNLALIYHYQQYRHGLAPPHNTPVP